MWRGCPAVVLASCLLNNCQLSGNVGGSTGGGAISCTLSNCLLSGNGVYGSGSDGGGAFSCVLINCSLIGNQANDYNATAGGATGSSRLTNCLVAGNSGYLAGGTAFGACEGCTIVGNSSSYGVGGVLDGVQRNCIIYNNSSGNYAADNLGISISYCCTTPAADGLGNITNEPLFHPGNYELETNSPCINSGNNTFIGSSSDLNGNPRIVGNTVDIGAYEFQSPSSILSYAWAQQFGLSTDGSSDSADVDGDGLNNWQEWIAGTNPTNAASVLAMGISSTNSSAPIVSWQSIAGKIYFIQRTVNLFDPSAFISIQSNLVGAADTTTYWDGSATNGGPYFYRVGVQ